MKLSRRGPELHMWLTAASCSPPKCYLLRLFDPFTTLINLMNSLVVFPGAEIVRRLGTLPRLAKVQHGLAEGESLRHKVVWNFFRHARRASLLSLSLIAQQPRDTLVPTLLLTGTRGIHTALPDPERHSMAHAWYTNGTSWRVLRLCPWCEDAGHESLMCTALARRAGSSTVPISSRNIPSIRSLCSKALSQKLLTEDPTILRGPTRSYEPLFANLLSIWHRSA